MLTFLSHAFRLHLEKAPLPKSLYYRRHVLSSELEVLHVKVHSILSPQSDIHKSLPKYMLGSDSVLSDWADRDEDNTSQREPDSME